MDEKDQQGKEPRYNVDSVSWVNDVLDDCQLGLFNKQKITAANTPGEAGVTMAKAAIATGISILTGIRGENGERIFGMDATKRGTEQEVSEYIEIFPFKTKVINIAFHIKNSLSDSLLPKLTSTVEGVDEKGGRKRNITSNRFESDSMGVDGGTDMEIANNSRWTLANCTVMDDLAWIEAQFTIYDVITNPMTPLSIIAMTDEWDDHIADDEYWAGLFKRGLAYERQKLIETLDAEKESSDEENVKQ